MGSGAHYALVVAAVSGTTGDNYSIDISISSLDALELSSGRALWLQFGFSRADNTIWSQPSGVAISAPPPPLPELRDYEVIKGVRRTPLGLSEDGNFLKCSLSVPRKLAPLSLGFVLYASDNATAPLEGEADPGVYLTPVQGRHCTVLVGAGPGSPLRLGATLVSNDGFSCAVNFALVSRKAAGVSLALYRKRQVVLAVAQGIRGLFRPYPRLCAGRPRPPPPPPQTVATLKWLSILWSTRPGTSGISNSGACGTLAHCTGAGG